MLLVTPAASLDTQAASTRATGYDWHVPILTYHFLICPPASTPQGSRYLYVCPDLFRAQLRAMQDDGWTFITAAQFGTLFMADSHPSPKTVVLTIDGTDAGDYDVAFPILRNLGIKATFFVSPGRLGLAHDETWSDLKQMRLDYQDIENHGMHHLNLTKLHGEALLREIGDASDAIQAHLGYRPSVLCYANGLNDAEVRAAVHRVEGLKIAPATHSVAVPYSKPLESSLAPLQMIRLSAKPVSPLQLLNVIRPYANG